MQAHFLVELSQCSASGIFAVFSLMVRQRRLEWGLRIALGERPESLVSRVVRRGLYLSSIGLSLGVVVFLVFGRLLESLVFGVTVSDLTTHSLTAAAVLLVGVAATLVPAYQASRVRPHVVLRDN